MVLTYNGILLSHKKVVPFAATWIQLEIIILTEVSQKEKDKYHMISHIWKLKYNTNELIYETDSDIENRLVIAKWERVEGGRLGLKDVSFYIYNE